MNSPMITVQNHRYPFGHSTHPQTKVIQMQYFKTLDQLQQKKKELTKKSQLINNQSIIKLLGVNQKGMALVYNYQFVPHSFESYLRSKWEEQPAEIWGMTKKLFAKKVTFELTLLTSYLGKMKIQTELGMQHLGINKDQKLKLYVSPKSKMGIKQEIQLIIVYNQNKQKILKELQQLYTHIESNSLRSNQVSQNAKNSFQNLSHNRSQIFSSGELKSLYKQNNNSSSKLPLNPTQSFLRQTRTFKDSTSQFRPRKMSTGNFQLNSGANIFKNTQKLQESKTPKAHKYSFQFGAPSEQSSFNQSSFVEKQEEPEPSYSKAKSIKIQLQQKQNLGSKKQRKDSYKVKITTVRQYDLGENPSNIFGGAPNNEDDIFQYFAKRSKGKAEEDEMSQDPQKSQDKCRKQTVDTNFTNHEVPEPSSPFSPLSTKQRKQSQNSTSRNRLLEQRIRQAKERTSKALNLMKNLKK